MEENGIALHKGLAMTEEDCLRRDVIKQLICNFKISVCAIRKQYNINFKQHFAEDLALLAPLAADGLLEIGDEQIVVSGKAVCWFVIFVCVWHLLAYKPSSSNFSRII